MSVDAADRQLAEDLVEALQPAAARWRAMFGGACFYLDDKPTGLINDGAVFVKDTPAAAEALHGWARLAPAYPGAKDSWRLPAAAIAHEPERVRAAVLAAAAQLPAPRPRRR
ncbi:TfoX/Sxy family protein [Brevibacterium sp. BRM-1]|uniref:TfoX/Sxy family protein n=1 Tax=Brevibacterium sp. BRM-1 TaxID=2999062 RepID=UPI00227E540E|nr:TfoX/Sxy family protein [Brevibacterium sp. BRM-1]WAL39242.1 TfoX/Sxy family protein [Brevibacterium sp. BRM-1]